MTLNVGPPAAETEERPNDFTGLILLALAVLALGIFASWSWAFIVSMIIFMISFSSSSRLGRFLEGPTPCFRLILPTANQ